MLILGSGTSLISTFKGITTFQTHASAALLLLRAVGIIEPTGNVVLKRICETHCKKIARKFYRDLLFFSVKNIQQRGAFCQVFILSHLLFLNIKFLFIYTLQKTQLSGYEEDSLELRQVWSGLVRWRLLRTATILSVF